MKSIVRIVNQLFKRGKKGVIQEIHESKELMQLLAKSTKQKLTEEEKKKVKDQLFDILKMIPSFAIFILPFGSLILPILLKVIPNHLMLPSAFLEPDEDEFADKEASKTGVSTEPQQAN